jgi:hypothetical protein
MKVRATGLDIERKSQCQTHNDNTPEQGIKRKDSRTLQESKTREFDGLRCVIRGLVELFVYLHCPPVLTYLAESRIAAQPHKAGRVFKLLATVISTHVQHICPRCRGCHSLRCLLGISCLPVCPALVL